MIATVGGTKITTDVVQQAVERMVGNQAALPRAIMGQYVPVMTNQLVELYAKAYKAKQLGLTISDDELAGAIQQLVSQQLGGKLIRGLPADRRAALQLDRASVRGVCPYHADGSPLRRLGRAIAGCHRR